VNMQNPPRIYNGSARIRLPPASPPGVGGG